MLDFYLFSLVGVDNIMSLIVDIYQSRKSLAKLEDVVRQLKQDVMQQMDVPQGQREQAKNKLRDTVKQTVIQKVNGKNGNTIFKSLFHLVYQSNYFYDIEDLFNLLYNTSSVACSRLSVSGAREERRRERTGYELWYNLRMEMILLHDHLNQTHFNMSCYILVFKG